MVSDWVIRYNLDFNFQPAYECFQKYGHPNLIKFIKMDDLGVPLVSDTSIWIWVTNYIDPKFQRDIPSRTCCPNPIQSQVLEVEKRTEKEYSYKVGPPPVISRVITPITQFIPPLKGAIIYPGKLTHVP